MRYGKIAGVLVSCGLSAFVAAAGAPGWAQGAGEAKPHTPRLGEIMTFIQVRHGKLWFAGRAGNWELADFELDELKEGLEDAAKFFPTFKDVPLAAMVAAATEREVADLDKAIKIKSRRSFVAAFDKLTAGCNACHQAAKLGFIAIRRPGVPPFTNQSFAPARK